MIKISNTFFRTKSDIFCAAKGTNINVSSRFFRCRDKLFTIFAKINNIAPCGLNLTYIHEQNIINPLKDFAVLFLYLRGFLRETEHPSLFFVFRKDKSEVQFSRVFVHLLYVQREENGMKYLLIVFQDNFQA